MNGTPLQVEDCELCAFDAPTVYADDKLFVILVDDASYPGFCRVIWRDHVGEMSDLAQEDRLLLNETVFHVEQAIRETMAPTKVNVASLGNVVPHLHWHIVPRYADDAHFPAPVWAVAVRKTDESVLEARRAQLPHLAEAIAQRLQLVKSPPCPTPLN